MRILRTALLTVAGGVLAAFTYVMLVTSPFPVIPFSPRVDTVITDPGGIDLWTGEVRPLRGTARFGEGRYVFQYPEDPEDLRVIPVPVNFAVGSLLTLTVITLVSRRPRTTSPNPVVPAA
jgi:hypothetical protein